MVDSQFIESREFQLRDVARAFDVPPYKLFIEGETEGPAMVQMGQQYLNGPISTYCERWKAKGEKFFELDGDNAFLSMGLCTFRQGRSAVTLHCLPAGGWRAMDGGQ